MEPSEEATLTVNVSSPLIQKLGSMEGDLLERTAAQLYRLALLSQRKLSAEELQSFLKESYGLLELL